MLFSLFLATSFFSFLHPFLNVLFDLFHLAYAYRVSCPGVCTIMDFSIRTVLFLVGSVPPLSLSVCPLILLTKAQICCIYFQELHLTRHHAIIGFSLSTASATTPYLHNP
nr:hypothetical protein [Zea mays]